jgi:hypothetical protein
MVNSCVAVETLVNLAHVPELTRLGLGEEFGSDELN